MLCAVVLVVCPCASRASATDLWEDDHLVDAIGAGLRHSLHHVLAIGQAEHTWHGWDWLVLVTLFMHEEGQDEVGW
jgi:hypothetical protein